MPFLARRRARPNVVPGQKPKLLLATSLQKMSPRVTQRLASRHRDRCGLDVTRRIYIIHPFGVDNKMRNARHVGGRRA